MDHNSEVLQGIINSDYFKTGGKTKKIIYITEYKNIFGLCPFSENAMAPHSSTLAWKISWMEECGRLQSMGSLRVGHD